MGTFALNFSRPGAEVVAQYHMFLRLGHDGFRDGRPGRSDNRYEVDRESVLCPLGCYDKPFVPAGKLIEPR